MDKKERQLYLATVPSSAFESGNLKRYYGCLTCYPFISDKLNHPSFDVQDVINDYDYVHQSDLRNHPDYNAERTEALKLIQETFRLSAHILREHPDQLISQLLGRLSYPSLLENSYIQSFLEQAKAKIVPPALIPYLGSLQPPGTGLIRTFAGHSSGVVSVEITPDGTKIVSGCHDLTVKIWDMKTGKELHTLTGHSSLIQGVAITPDGTKIVSGGYDKKVKIWDVQTGQELLSLDELPGFVNGVAITPDGAMFVSCIDDIITVWDIETGQDLYTFSDDSCARIDGVTITPDGTKIVSYGTFDTIKVWDIRTGEIFLTLTGDSSRVRGIAITPDSEKIVSAGDDCIIKVWDIRTGKKLASHYVHLALVKRVAITSDGTKIVSASEDNTIKVCDITTGEILLTFTGHYCSVDAVAITPDDTKIVSGHDNTINIWDIMTKHNVYFQGKSHYTNKSIYGLKITPSGTKIVTFGGLIMQVWDIETGQELLTLTGHSGSNTWVDLHANKIYPGNNGYINSVEITPDGTKIISASNDATVKIWDITTGQELLTLAHPLRLQNGHHNYVKEVVIIPNETKIFSSSDDLLMSSSGDLKLRFWDITTGQELHVIDDSIKWDDPGEWGDIIEWEDPREYEEELVQRLNLINDFIKGKSVQELNDLCNDPREWYEPIERKKRPVQINLKDIGVKNRKMTPDEKKVVSINNYSDYPNSIKIWDNETAKILLTLTGHSSIVKEIAITPDGTKIISGSRDSSIKIWNLSTGKCLHTFIDDSPITAIAISPDGKKIIAGDEAGSLHFLELVV
ncbi:WD40 repeat domain-containing protein [Microcystis aeruginosa]|uniref:Putative WD40 repeat, subgroup n=1 Tax=Microcystis aeruginosa PCC 9701 TaxID=721123 RepID=I4IXR3_MICAE|nr:WD40 repeat domain-containing protein [Microcystis aeruginosa]CCI39087.1 putative WD40 repeat, subgroup [Microcystis aeruginosa PCC 9701]